MKDYGKEEVLVIPAEKIPPWEGIKIASQEILELLRGNSFSILRNKAEGNPDLKQIIPYCTLIHTDKKGVRRLFYAKRKSGADRELSGKWTIGLGGHINLKDRRALYQRLWKKKIGIPGLSIKNSFDVALLNCVKRELDEEVEMNWNDVIEIKYCTFLFTSSDYVSKDHLGISLTIRLKNRNVKIRKGELADGAFFTEEEFLIYTGYHDFIHFLHTPEGMEMERRSRKIIALCMASFMAGPPKNKS